MTITITKNQAEVLLPLARTALLQAIVEQDRSDRHELSDESQVRDLQVNVQMWQEIVDALSRE